MKTKKILSYEDNPLLKEEDYQKLFKKNILWRVEHGYLEKDDSKFVRYVANNGNKRKYLCSKKELTSEDIEVFTRWEWNHNREWEIDKY